jgi:hypothetical protein
MQNEPKFRKVKLNVNKVLTKNYEQMDTWSIGKNEPKRTQNEPKFKKAKMNVTAALTMEYENISNWAICENEPNTNPNKPNFKLSLPAFQVGQYMLPRMTINTRPNPLAHYAHEIEASAIPHNNGSNICRLTGELIGFTMFVLTF